MTALKTPVAPKLYGPTDSGLSAIAQRIDAALFDNPILVKHVRSRLRPSQALPWAALALVAAAAFHLLAFAPENAAQWIADNLKNALVINVVLAIFNMLPIPPLDGGRVAVGLLPNALAVPLSRLEPYGMLILIGILIVLPLAGSQFGLNLDVISAILRTTTGYVIQLVVILTGNA